VLSAGEKTSTDFHRFPITTSSVFVIDSDVNACGHLILTLPSPMSTVEVSQVVLDFESAS
jgi:hypothetical protein